MLQEELPDNLPRLIIPVAEYPVVATGSRDTSVPVGSESTPLDSHLVLAPPLLHALAQLQMRNDDNDGNLAVAEHLHEKVICVLDRFGDSSAPHAEHEEVDSAGPLECGNERVSLVDGIQVFFFIHVAVGLVQTSRIVQGELDTVEGDDVLLGLERAASGTTRSLG